uniref:Uncharacterized protein n=1 Tax=Utricularia reniformis TaxID=192314 RepID=A0A1Y0B084_9LAMI|nr:hypothetical protein AEK19_MT0525 [Utricularia reniformis]ART30781.1 hypothetical protein AEK19_MT0525 [Utricularia reniformis]
MSETLFIDCFIVCSQRWGRYLLCSLYRVSTIYFFVLTNSVHFHLLCFSRWVRQSLTSINQIIVSESRFLTNVRSLEPLPSSYLLHQPGIVNILHE